MLTHTLKPKDCRMCGASFVPRASFATCCSPMCARHYVIEAKKYEKATLKARKVALKRIPDLIKEAQVAFNAYIRERDRGQPCISCDAPLEAEGGGVGGGYDCGHYRSTGSASHLRFNEANAHAQCKHCNRHKAGNTVEYRSRLLHRIGAGSVLVLEANNDVHKWERDELIAIRAHYTAKLKELKGKA